MSFAMELKTALCGVQAKACCRFAELYALFLYGGAFRPDAMFYSGRPPAVAEWLQKCLKRDFSVLGRVASSGGRVTLSVEGAADRKKLLNHFSTHTSFFRRECCRAAYLRGVFLACGHMNDPEKDYRLEFSIKDAALAADLEQFLLQCGFAVKLTRRGTSTVLYFRNSRQIEDLLTFMGASGAALETAAIKKLCAAGRLDTLPEELQAAARLRMENPESPLSELCALSTVPITRSGLNHRLNRLMEIAAQL